MWVVVRPQYWGPAWSDYAQAIDPSIGATELATCKRTQYRHHREMCLRQAPGRPLRLGSRRSAGAVVQALADAKPDAIFSSLFAADLQKFVAA